MSHVRERFRHMLARPTCTLAANIFDRLCCMMEVRALGHHTHPSCTCMESIMKVGVSMTISSRSIPVTVLAQKAESLGFESLWLPEHPIIPVHTSSRWCQPGAYQAVFYGERRRLDGT